MPCNFFHTKTSPRGQARVHDLLQVLQRVPAAVVVHNGVVLAHVLEVDGAEIDEDHAQGLLVDAAAIL